jgi:hypothetical protein
MVGRSEPGWFRAALSSGADRPTDRHRRTLIYALAPRGDPDILFNASAHANYFARDA